MYQKILLPLDGSKRAERIFAHVEKIARDNGATVIFLTVVRPPRVFGYDDMQYAHFEKQIDTGMAQSADYLKGVEAAFNDKGIDTRQKVDTGPVVNLIIDTAQRESVDLVAICSHGRGGLSRLFYGSVASGILNRIDRPLLVIRARGNS